MQNNFEIHVNEGYLSWTKKKPHTMTKPFRNAKLALLKWTTIHVYGLQYDISINVYNTYWSKQGIINLILWDSFMNIDSYYTLYEQKKMDWLHQNIFFLKKYLIAVKRKHKEIDREHCPTESEMSQVRPQPKHGDGNAGQDLSFDSSSPKPLPSKVFISKKLELEPLPEIKPQYNDVGWEHVNHSANCSPKVNAIL